MGCVSDLCAARVGVSKTCYLLGRGSALLVGSRVRVCRRLILVSNDPPPRRRPICISRMCAARWCHAVCIYVPTCVGTPARNMAPNLASLFVWLDV